MDIVMLDRWFHIIAGVLWIGLLYYFNFVQVPSVAQATADSDGPGPAAINKYVAPRALLWFRWAALATWLSGALYLILAPAHNIVTAFTLGIGTGNLQATCIGMGAWLGTFMLFNVWVLIWPNQKKILGFVEASDDEKAKAKRTAFLASRSNTLMSIPMLMFMHSGAGYPLPF
ncbi:MAG: urate hydroxylase PuuD [Pseudomonadota bacterium]